MQSRRKVGLQRSQTNQFRAKMKRLMSCFMILLVLEVKSIIRTSTWFILWVRKTLKTTIWKMISKNQTKIFQKKHLSKLLRINNLLGWLAEDIPKARKNRKETQTEIYARGVILFQISVWGNLKFTNIFQNTMIKFTRDATSFLSYV